MKAKILVVDDDEGIRQLLRSLLHHDGYEVTEASALAGLRRALLGPPPDAVILDLQLPDGSGLEMLPVLKQKWPGVKVIILTGHGTVEAAEEAYKQMEDVLMQSKPFDPETFRALLELALARSSPSRTPRSP
jgi:DNA-binding NtrC family response regulator